VRLRLSFLALLFAFAIPATAQSTQNQSPQDRTADVQTAFNRAQHLKHGINASGWFGGTGDTSAEHIASFTDDADIALIAKMGFDHVRVSIDPMPLVGAMVGFRGNSNPQFVKQLDHAVDTMLADGLAVIIDVHPSDDYKQKMRTDDQAVERFTSTWRRLAAHYADRDPNMVFFEILNEPEINDAYRWAGIQARVAAAIREQAPHHTIIAAGAVWSDIWDLVALEPLADGNVIYNFHFYEPHEFTHQGATWSTPWYSYEHGIPYPPTESSMPELLKQAPDAPTRYYMEKYWLDGWNAHRIQMMIDNAAAWAHDNHVPLICNEFGTIRDFPDPVSRANWLHDVRTALETDGIGWAMWDYRGNFGVVTKENGQPAQVDDSVVKALGLQGHE
jgi:aryl-phospho-beta-D-glucosidase BglC (GH1 family)